MSGKGGVRCIRLSFSHSLMEGMPKAMGEEGAQVALRLPQRGDKAGDREGLRLALADLEPSSLAEATSKSPFAPFRCSFPSSSSWSPFSNSK